ncbi:MAG TPA: hypothetical protein VF100_07735 [Thermoanaerobaculia bacterium]
MEAAPLNARLKRKLADLGKALSEAISESSLASRHLAELRQEGYSVYLLLESDGERGEGAQAAEGRRSGALSARSRGERDEAGDAARQHAAQRQLTGRSHPPGDRQLPASTAEPDPTFLIDGRDLAFLRSVGIDPTRPARRRKS